MGDNNSYNAVPPPTQNGLPQNGEGQSTQRPPLFDGNNYNYWKCCMRIYLQSFNLEIWKIVESAYSPPTTPVDEWSNNDKKLMQTNAKAMNALFCDLERNEFNRVSNCKTAHEIWHIQEVTHEGTTRVKESKISVLVHKFELFSMNDGESIKVMYTRFTDITNSLIGIGKTYTSVECVRKILLALNSDWEKKVTAIEEANDLSTLSVEDLIGNLMAYEVNLQERRKEESRKKGIAFKAIEENDESNEDDDLNLMTRAFKNFLKIGNFRNSKDKSEPTCYRCKKPGHIKPNCPLNKSNDKKARFKKALEACWEDDTSSEDEANMCFTVKEVCKTLEYIELLTAFNSVLNKYKEVKKENKSLTQDAHNLQLHNESLIKEVNTFLHIQDDLDNVKKIHKKTIKENEHLKEKNLCLEKEISEVKAKYEEISANVKEFNKGKEKLHDLLKFQNNDKNKFGLGFDENSAKKVSKKSTLEEVFIKKQPSFKNSHNSNKDSVFNKPSQPNKSNHYLNKRISYSKRPNDRFRTQNVSNSRNSYSNGNNLRHYHPYNYSTSYRNNYEYNSSNFYNDYNLHARNAPYAYSNRRYNNHARYHNNDFYRRDNFRYYDSINSSTYKHVNTNSIWIPKDLNIDERKKYIISHLYNWKTNFFGICVPNNNH